MKHRIFKRYRAKKRGGQHYWTGRSRKNYGATFEIKIVHPHLGKKTKLLLLREDIEDNLGVLGIPRERREYLKERLENLNDQLKRIQGNPPIEVVRGKTPSMLKLDLLTRYKGTSSRRPAFVEELNLPLKEIIPKNKEILRLRAREQFGFKKGLETLQEKAIEEAVKGRTPQLSIQELKRKNFGSIRGLTIPELSVKAKKVTEEGASKLDDILKHGNPQSIIDIGTKKAGIEKKKITIPGHSLTTFKSSSHKERVLTSRLGDKFITVANNPYTMIGFESDTKEEAEKVHKKMEQEAEDRFG